MCKLQNEVLICVNYKHLRVTLILIFLTYDDGNIKY